MSYSISVYKQYFNFAASHFLIFKDGTREPLHGHNYYVSVSGAAPELEGDMVFDFLDIKPIVREVCDKLDHKLLLPKLNSYLKCFDQNKNYLLKTPDGSEFSIPKQDVLLLPIENTSAERLAQFLCGQIIEEVYKQFNFCFQSLEVTVEETRGQSATYKSLK